MFTKPGTMDLASQVVETYQTRIQATEQMQPVQGDGFGWRHVGVDTHASTRHQALAKHTFHRLESHVTHVASVRIDRM